MVMLLVETVGDLQAIFEPVALDRVVESICKITACKPVLAEVCSGHTSHSYAEALDMVVSRNSEHRSEVKFRSAL